MGRPKLLNDTHNHYFDPQQERSKTIAIGTRRWCGNAGKGGGRSRSAVAIRPIWKNEVYSDNQAEDLLCHKEVFPELDAWTDLFARFVEAKGKVEPNKYRAFWLQNAWSFASRCHARVAGHPYALRKSAYAFFTSETKTARVEP